MAYAYANGTIIVSVPYASASYGIPKGTIMVSVAIIFEPPPSAERWELNQDTII